MLTVSIRENHCLLSRQAASHANMPTPTTQGQPGGCQLLKKQPAGQASTVSDQPPLSPPPTCRCPLHPEPPPARTTTSSGSSGSRRGSSAAWLLREASSLAAGRWLRSCSLDSRWPQAANTCKDRWCEGGGKAVRSQGGISWGTLGLTLLASVSHACCTPSPPIPSLPCWRSWRCWPPLLGQWGCPRAARSGRLLQHSAPRHPPSPGGTAAAPGPRPSAPPRAAGGGKWLLCVNTAKGGGGRCGYGKGEKGQEGRGRHCRRVAQV